MSILVMDQRRSSLPVVSIVNQKTGNTKLIINEIDFVPGEHVLWEDYINAGNKIVDGTDAGNAATIVIAETETPVVVTETETPVVDAISAKKAARAQREKDIKVAVEVTETPSEIKE